MSLYGTLQADPLIDGVKFEFNGTKSLCTKNDLECNCQPLILLLSIFDDIIVIYLFCYLIRISTAVG